MSIAPVDDAQDNDISYDLAPTLKEFMEDDSYFRGIKGPIGSGKSTMCCMEIMRRAVNQKPFRGIRKTKWAIIRNTYGELKTTTIQTWLNWFGDITKMLYDQPINGHVKVNLPDGTRLSIELLFLAMDRPEDTKKILSLDITGVWVNEAREIPKKVMTDALSRCGRYPIPTHGGPSWYGGFADTNPPSDRRTEDNWWFWFSEIDKLDHLPVDKRWTFYSQT